MKFSAGYVLGAATVVGLGAAFCGGLGLAVWVLDKAEAKKNTELEKMKETSVQNIARDMLRRKPSSN